MELILNLIKNGITKWILTRPGRKDCGGFQWKPHRLILYGFAILHIFPAHIITRDIMCTTSIKVLDSLWRIVPCIYSEKWKRSRRGIYKSGLMLMDSNSNWIALCFLLQLDPPKVVSRRVVLFSLILVVVRSLHINADEPISTAHNPLSFNGWIIL
jgi:hypothetical protein